ncbi:MAG: putative enzyme related to lactoylglutathione lyase [Luteibaculaceae bacterium]|jgi:predicted enzyme related to lactoylglutathione lyase
MGSTSSKKTLKVVKLKDYISWFEIPVVNFQKAVSFYNHIYGIEMESFMKGDHTMAMFPTDTGIGGAIVCGPGSVPSEKGPLLYLNGGSDLNNVLSRVDEAGGRVIMDKTFINADSGYFGIFIDSEGNKLALHSKN